MSNNRHLIDNSDVASLARMPEKGIHILGLFGHCSTNDAWCAAITDNGVLSEILRPRHHHLDRYGLFRGVKTIPTDLYSQLFNISTWGE
jgi:hypothetical protein